MSSRVAILALLLVVAGCSSTTFFYNRLDFFLPWYLGRYVDLDASQSDWFEDQLDVLLVWHRREELPRYVEMLASIEGDLNGTVTLERLQMQTQVLEDAWYDLRDPALEILLDLGARLEQEQIDDFIEVLEKRQRKYERKYLKRSDETFREDAQDDLEDGFADFLGRLTSEQRARVAATVERLTRSDATWLAERAAWTSEMKRLLEREPGWQARVRKTIHDWEDELDEEAGAVYDRNTLLVQELMVEVLNLRSERQDRRLRRRLTSLREDLQSLSEQGRSGDDQAP